MTVSKKEYFLKDGEFILIKPNEPNSLIAFKPFKMLLVKIKIDMED